MWRVAERGVDIGIPLPAELDDEELERRLYRYGERPRSERVLPDLEAVYRELKRPGVTLEHTPQIAVHESPRTTKLYDRTTDELTVDEIERIVIWVRLQILVRLCDLPDSG